MTLVTNNSSRSEENHLNTSVRDSKILSQNDYRKMRLSVQEAAVPSMLRSEKGQSTHLTADRQGTPSTSSSSSSSSIIDQCCCIVLLYYY